MRFRQWAGLLMAATACNSPPPAVTTQCIINGVTVASAAINPANPCQSCQPKASATDWSSLAPGIMCGGGGAICVGGSCLAGCYIGGVFHAPDTLNPSMPCQSCQPGLSSADWSPLTGGPTAGCSSDQVCEQGACHTGCRIQGTLFEPGDSNPGAACQVCNPTVTTSDWTASPDGQLCGNLVCFAGRCQSGCVIVGALYSPGQLNPANGCQSCQPAVAVSTFAPLDGVPTGSSCSSGQVCNAGNCASGCFISGSFAPPSARNGTDHSLCCHPQSDTTGWTPAFKAKGMYPTGHGPVGIASADFNGDGKADLVTANRADGTVDVFFGVGDGTFTGPLVLTVGSGPVAIAAADLNGDQHPDIVVGNADDQSVSVLLNSGAGSAFQPQVIYGTKGYPSAVVIADVDGDGRPDIAVTNLDQATVAVLPNLGSGTFGVAAILSVGNFPQAIAALDLNGDGLVDLAVAAGNDNAVDVLLGQGGGAFGPMTPYAVGVNPMAIAAADLSGDGHPDLVVANSFDNTLGVLLGQPGGTFAPQVTYALGTTVYSFAIADLNGDAIPDLGVADYAGGQVGILINQGAGAFQQPFFEPVGRPFSAYAITAVDANGDGASDLPVAGLDNATLSIVINSCP